MCLSLPILMTDRCLQMAHGILFETIRQLEDQGIHVPQSLRRSFVLLHSYILVGPCEPLATREEHQPLFHSQSGGTGSDTTQYLVRSCVPFVGVS